MKDKSNINKQKVKYPLARKCTETLVSWWRQFKIDKIIIVIIIIPETTHRELIICLLIY